jgi:hypothetical protein
MGSRELRELVYAISIAADDFLNAENHEQAQLCLTTLKAHALVLREDHATAQPDTLREQLEGVRDGWRERAAEFDDGSGASSCAQSALNYRNRANELDHLLASAPTPANPCESCGKDNAIEWLADNKLWDQFVHAGTRQLCLSCFDSMAEKQGVILFWTPKISKHSQLNRESAPTLASPGVGEPGRAPGEDSWLDEIQLVTESASTMTEERDKLRTILRAYRANLLTNLAAAPPAQGAPAVTPLKHPLQKPGVDFDGVFKDMQPAPPVEARAGAIFSKLQTHSSPDQKRNIIELALQAAERAGMERARKLLEQWEMEAAENAVKEADLRERLNRGETVQIISQVTCPQIRTADHYIEGLRRVLAHSTATAQPKGDK